jgi:hypothetical protein
LRDGNLPLVERNLIDFLRRTIPNIGGITAARKISVVVDESQLTAVASVTEPRPGKLYQGEPIQRPDGSHLYL